MLHAEKQLMNITEKNFQIKQSEMVNNFCHAYYGLINVNLKITPAQMGSKFSSVKKTMKNAVLDTKLKYIKPHPQQW